MIAEDHPLSLGCIERARRQVQRELLHSADLVIGLGYDVVEVEHGVDALTELFSGAQVVCNTVGPFAKYGMVALRHMLRH